MINSDIGFDLKIFSRNIFFIQILGFSNRDQNIKSFMTIGLTKSKIIQIASILLGEEFETMNAEVRGTLDEIVNNTQARKYRKYHY